uniref:Uncharacterized protein n=1 Tax=Ignavibacterium album TaxID=591197 RepID=A0A7V2ZKE6_9BACT
MKNRFYESVIRLDKILLTKMIDSKELNILKRLISTNSLANYFWQNLRQLGWIKVLKDEGFFDILSERSANNNELYITQSFVSEYLLNVADKYPNEVIEIIKETDTDNARVIWNYVRIGLALDPKYTAKLVPMVKKWLGNLKMNSILFDSDIIKWVKHLSDSGQFDAAFKLLKILTNPKVQKPIGVRDKEVEKIIGKDRPKAVTVIDYYYLKELLSKGLSKLVENNPERLSRILQQALEKTIKIEYGHTKWNLDLSYIWRAAIEDHPQNYEYYRLTDVLLNALRSSTEVLARNDKEIGLEIINEYFNHRYSIFRRLAIHLLRLNYDNYSIFVKELIKNKELLKETAISHEYYILLRDIFEKLDISVRQFIINSILDIQNYDPEAKPDIQEKQIRYHHVEKLHFFEKYLEGKEKEYYDSLKQEFTGETIRDTPVWRESSVGEKSPLTIDEIDKKDISELWNLFKTFRKTEKGFDAPSPEGLARYFGAAVRKNPHKYLSKDLTPLTHLKPNFAYWFINDVTELYKSEKYPELVPYIENLLNFINIIIRIENIPKRFTDYMGINFAGVKRRALDFIQMSIKSSQKGIINLSAYKSIIWEIIEYLCYYEWDPAKSIENTTTNLDPFTLAINSVRGNAVIAAIDYALWQASLTKDSFPSDIKYPNRLVGEEQIQKLLEDKLINKQDDPSLAIHSIFGVYLANLAYLNYEWVKANIENIFPSESEKEIYWMTAWSGYINASRFYTDLYNLLRPQFERAIDYLSRGKPIISSGLGRSPEDALAEHLIVSCLNGLDDIHKKGSLLRRFAKIPNNLSAAHAVQFIANLAKDEMIFRELPELNPKSFWPQAKEFWKIRIKIANKQKIKRKTNDEDEFDREFSGYITWLDDLPQEVTLKELEKLLAATIDINQSGWNLPDLVEYLSKHSEQNPLIAVRLFYQLMQTNAPTYFYQGKEQEIEIILKNAIKTKKNEAYFYADYIANKFGEWGNYYFKDFWIENLKGKKIKRLRKVREKK